MFGIKRRYGRIRRLEEALQWYADESHWRRKATNPKGSPRRWSKSAAARDRGGRARVALAGGWSRALWNDARNAFFSRVVANVAKGDLPASIAGLVNNPTADDHLPLVPDQAISGRADDTE